MVYSNTKMNCNIYSMKKTQVHFLSLPLAIIIEKHLTQNSNLNIMWLLNYTKLKIPWTSAHACIAIVIFFDIEYHEFSSFQELQMQATIISMWTQNIQIEIATIYCSLGYEINS